MYRTIMVPLDGSPFAEAALDPAMSLARMYSARLELVSVRAPVPNFADDAWEIEPKGWRKDYLDETARRVAKASGILPETVVREGLVERELVDEIRGGSVDLVVLATHGRGPFSRFWLGSVADALVRTSPAPVLLVRPDARTIPEPAAGGTRIARVLVPLDQSEESEAVLLHVRALAGVTGAEIVLLHVVHFPTELVSSYPPDTMRLYEQLVEEGYREGDAYLSGLAATLAKQGLDVSTRVRVDVHPATGIVRAAEEETADLVAMSTHGVGGVRRALLGSVTDKVIRALHVPVLAVRPDQPAAGAGAEEAA